MVRWALVAVVAAVLALTACGSDYHYVSNRGGGAYFKVPSSWEVFEEEPVLRARDASLSADETEELADTLWIRGFDSAREPAVEHVFDPGTGAPSGYAEVREIRPRDRDSLSYADLRRVGFPFQDPGAGGPIDPLMYDDEEGPIRVLEYDDGLQDGALGDLELRDGLRGIRLRTRVAVDPRSPVIVEQINVVDAGTETRFSFVVACSRDCWEANEDLIGTVADSWTLEQRT
jgi:hypothetical protein